MFLLMRCSKKKFWKNLCKHLPSVHWDIGFPFKQNSENIFGPHQKDKRSLLSFFFFFFFGVFPFFFSWGGGVPIVLQWGKDPTVAAQVAVEAWVQSLAWKLPHAPSLGVAMGYRCS